MKSVLTVEQMRAFDAHAIREAHVPGFVLMENAGRGAADVAESMLRDAADVESATPAGRRAAGRPVVVLAGTGNNGGDGLVVARHLRTRGHACDVLLVGSADRVAGDARLALEAYRGVGGEVRELAASDTARLPDTLRGAALVVDALFGTGLDRAVTGLPAEVIGAVRQAGVPVLALDLPSGLHGDTGAELGVVVHATRTVTFAAYKPGLLTPAGAAAAGEVRVVDIGVPPSLLPPNVQPSAFLLEDRDVRAAFAPRPLGAHKGTEGHVLVLAGSPGKIGAARLVARGAHRAGAGLVTVATQPEAADAFDTLALETMTAPLPPNDDEALVRLLSGKRAVVVGPGLGLGEEARHVVLGVVRHFAGPVVFDADALTILAEELAVLHGSAVLPILTPHPGEAGRLLGTDAGAVEANRFEAARTLAKRAGATVVLKGAFTLVATPDGTVYVNPTGSPALATAGAGDVLAGITGALAARVSPREAVCAAVYAHGRAAETWSHAHGSRGLLASEVADHLPSVALALGRG